MTPKFKAPRNSTPRHSAARFVALCALLIAASVPVFSQQPISLAEADQRVAAWFQQSATTGMVLVVVRNHEVLIKTYGEAIPGTGHAPEPNSLIRLCSVSKVFTADLLLRLASEGKVAITDPLQRFAPPGTTVPDGADGTKITLLNLATHTAGLTREVSSYPRKTPHFTFPNRAFRWTWLPTQTLTAPPGTTATYSNVGFDLLGDALASATHQSYAQLLHDRLLQPLNMWDSTLVPSADQCARLMQGSSDQGPCTDTQASGPSGGIYSTPADMVKLLQYLLRVPGSPTAPEDEFTIYVQPKQLNSVYGLNHAGDPTGIGLAWIRLGDPATTSMVMEKTGGGAGFETYIALNPQTKTGVFLAATDGKGDSHINFFEDSNTLLAAIAGVPPLPPKVHHVRPVPKHPRRPKGKRTTRPAPRHAI